MCTSCRPLPAFFLFVTFAALAGPASAQLLVMGRIVDEANAPVSFANVQLLVRADSSLARGAVADEAGRFLLDAVKPGDYLLYVTLLGYEPYFSDVLVLTGEGERRLDPITLRQGTVEMQEMSVEARRLLYEQQGDRLVINVGNSVTLSGLTALDVLERSPGVLVNRQANTLSLIGKDGVRVMINGRLSYIPADGLVQYLAGMSADNIMSIELITSPSADFDAEGNAGYINIVLKRNPEDGLSGTLTASGGYGKGEVSNASLTADYRRSRVSVFGSYSFVWNGQQQRFSNYRRIIEAGGVTELPTVATRDPVRRIHNARFGLDYRISDRTTVGVLAGAFDNRWRMDALNELSIRTNGTLTSRIRSDNDEVNHWQHTMSNVHVQHQLARAGTLSADVDYLYYYNSNPTDYLNTSTDLASGQSTEEQMESRKVTPFYIIVAKVDYLTKLGGKWDLGAGAKGAFSRLTNRARFGSLVQDAWVAEVGLSSKSILREDVLALYAKADLQVSKAASLKMGVRYELTDSNLGSATEQDLVDRRFGSLFPSVAYSHRLNEAHQVGASYTRRITRPAFSDMAPFMYFIDPQTFFTGNTTLQPALIQTVKLDYTYKSLLVSIAYAQEDSTIARFQNRVLAEQRVQLIFPTNFSAAQIFTAILALPVQATGWWSMQNNLTLLWQQVDGFLNDSPVALQRESFRINTTQNISLPLDLALEASGFYQSGGLGGLIRFSPIWGVNVGLQRALPGNRGKLVLSVNDVFDSIKMRGTTGSPGDPIYLKRTLDFSQRTFQLTYSTRFGHGKAARKRATASEEESGRVQQ